MLTGNIASEYLSLEQEYYFKFSFQLTLFSEASILRKDLASHLTVVDSQYR